MVTDAKAVTEPTGLAAVRAWARGGPPPGDDALSDLRGLVARTVLGHDRATLRTLHETLTPAAAALNRRLATAAVPPWVPEAAGIPVLAAVVRAALHGLEWDDVGGAIAGIRHGAALLRAIAKAVAALGREHQEYVSVQLGELAAAAAEGSAEPPSPSTVSRGLSALDEAGLIHLAGATRARRCAILPRAWAWLDATSAPAVRLVPPEATGAAREGGGEPPSGSPPSVVEPDPPPAATVVPLRGVPSLPAAQFRRDVRASR